MPNVTIVVDVLTALQAGNLALPLRCATQRFAEAIEERRRAGDQLIFLADTHDPKTTGSSSLSVHCVRGTVRVRSGPRAPAAAPGCDADPQAPLFRVFDTDLEARLRAAQPSRSRWSASAPTSACCTPSPTAHTRLPGRRPRLGRQTFDGPRPSRRRGAALGAGSSQGGPRRPPALVCEPLQYNVTVNRTSPFCIDLRRRDQARQPLLLGLWPSHSPKGAACAFALDGGSRRLLAILLVVLPGPALRVGPACPLPPTSAPPAALSTRIYDRTGTVLLAEIPPGLGRRHIVPLKQVAAGDAGSDHRRRGP